MRISRHPGLSISFHSAWVLLLFAIFVSGAPIRTTAASQVLELSLHRDDLQGVMMLPDWDAQLSKTVRVYESAITCDSKSLDFDCDEVVVLERRNIFKKLWNKVKEGFNKVKEGVKNVVNKVKEGVKKAVEKVKEVAVKVKDGVKKAAEKVKEGVGKAVTWVKENGAKVAKFGLKVAATVASVAEKVVRFIPVVGPGASGALKGATIGLNKASDAIKADLGPKLSKGMKVMDIVQDPIGAAAHKLAEKAAQKAADKVAQHRAKKG